MAGSEQRHGIPSQSTFWTIPPIQDAIALHLFPHDRFNCTLVCHAFRTWATPFLWSTVELFSWPRHRSFFESPALAQNHSYVTHLTMTTSVRDLVHCTVTIPDDVVFPRIRSLAVWGSGIGEEAMDLVSFMGARRGLKSFRSNRLSTHPEYMHSLSTTIIRHTVLQELELDFDGAMKPPDLVRFLQACIYLKKLRIRAFFQSVDHPLSPAGDTFQECALQELNLNLFRGPVYPVVLLFLKHCPRLERFSWERDYETAEDAKALAVTLQRHCPCLVDLELAHLREARHVELVYSGLVGLKRMAFSLPSPPENALSAIILHGNSLEVLAITERGEISFRMLQTIVRSCAGLNTLLARLNIDGSDPYTELEDPLVSGPWACVGLNTLGLFFPIPLDYSVGTASKLSLLFEQVGQLKKLEQLSLVVCGREPRLAMDLLNKALEQTRVVNLKTFELCGHLEETPQEQFELMVAIWPRLRLLIVRYGPDYLQPGGFLRERFKEVRPFLTIQTG